MWNSDHRYHIDDYGNVFIQHNEANKESWIEVMSIEDAMSFFVDKIHKGWQQRKYMGSFMDKFIG